MAADGLVLMVEDDPDDEELARSSLEKHHIGRIVSVHDGLEALEYLHNDDRELPKVVLLDLKLPKLDGHEVLRRIRAHPRTQYLPVVVMTSSKQDRDRIGSYRHGANSYVIKPIDFDQFRDAIRQLGTYWVGINEPA
ncbi:MAG TPA: response regulator [Candidatus Limnocylindrales bacterium]|nr:response regulator [Candidatus Limnocylindrales bacterium]